MARQARRGEARQAWRGRARQGSARLGRRSRQSKARQGKVWQGMAGKLYIERRYNFKGIKPLKDIKSIGTKC